MNVIAVSDFRNNLSDYLNRVVYSGEDIYIKKGKSVVAKISKTKRTDKKLSLLDLAGVISEDEADKLNAYIESLDVWDNDTA
ncbi:MAG: hypothetical protein UX80_C0022G0013 [Candidatus Amesbacteria bacterium GW2011_GWA2_47_11b]|uniref:Uncharacterized protein n=1 Tax=Candidatus Amesbacteria bacterium GW2011_GWA2_47_11b TaxID=1618358 RepID=A0A0G1TSV8_9BACT|nr:MAG: hypothetical protein UX80_C0022G0013 [Candidatus Amesbacteria bacterium GW2011_GWA2_47_11b]